MLQSVRCVLKTNILKCGTIKLKRFLQVKFGWLNSKHKSKEMHYEHLNSSKCIPLRAITAYKLQSLIFIKIIILMFSYLFQKKNLSTTLFEQIIKTYFLEIKSNPSRKTKLFKKHCFIMLHYKVHNIKVIRMNSHIHSLHSNYYSLMQFKENLLTDMIS